MAPYHIRKYQEMTGEMATDLFSEAMAEHIPTTFCHILKLPQTLVLLLGTPRPNPSLWLLGPGLRVQPRSLLP